VHIVSSDYLQLDGPALRVLAHPLRSRLLGALRTAGPATATGLAQQLGTNTGATSYHLRKLADVGLVVEEDRGTARERWWRAAQRSHGWRESELDAADPDVRHAAAWLRGHYLRQFAELSAGWEVDRERWPLPWREHTGIGDALVRVSADQLGELVAELWRTIERYGEAAPADSPMTPDSRLVSIYLAALPHDPGRPPGQPLP